MEKNLENLVKGLDSPKFFNDSVNITCCWMKNWANLPPGRKAACMDVLKRLPIVLNDQYSKDKEHWQAGLKLFTLGLSVCEDPKDAELVQSYIDRCTEFLDNTPDGTPAPGQSCSYL
jgi:hypothetical protein